MLGHSDNASPARNRCWTPSGLGSNYGLQPYLDTVYRGYGWGQLIDDDFFQESVVWDFRSNAAQTTGSVKKQRIKRHTLS